MRVFLTVLILIFNLRSLSKANDISELEVEGISIGDSLLKIMSEEEIIADMSTMYKNKKFSTVIYFRTETYDAIQFSFYTNDTNYIVYSIEAKLIFKHDIKSCLNKQKEITNAISEMIGSYTTYYPVEKQTRQSDPSGKSFMYPEAFVFKEDDSMVQIYCTDWSEDFENKNWHDELKVSIWSDDFSNFLEAIFIRTILTLKL